MEELLTGGSQIGLIFVGIIMLIRELKSFVKKPDTASGKGVVLAEHQAINTVLIENQTNINLIHEQCERIEGKLGRIQNDCAVMLDRTK